MELYRSRDERVVGGGGEARSMRCQQGKETGELQRDRRSMFLGAACQPVGIASDPVIDHCGYKRVMVAGESQERRRREVE
eukprot:748378-Hanusia_phi.AAC.8